MINTTVKLSKAKRIFITDILVLLSVYFIPALSHLTSFPLYMLDPMRILLFTGYIASRNKKNALILAITLPFFSLLVSGHPPFYKALLISMELFINIYVLIYLMDKKKCSVSLVLFVSILLSKFIYYILKYLFISLTLLQGSLVTTNLLAQFAITIFITLVFSLLYKKLEDKQIF